jgi:hypothetical protein
MNIKNKNYSKTYMLLTPQEITKEYSNDYIDSDIFKNILNSNGWKQIRYDEHINFYKLKQIGIGFIYSTGTASYNKLIYKIPVFIKNLFEFKSHRFFTNKYEVYLKMKEYIGDDITKYMAESWHLDDLEKLPENNVVYIARPIEGFKGIGIENIINNEELNNLKIKYENIINTPKISYLNKKIYDKGIMISRYFTNPLLFNKKKFHLRSYLLINKYWNKTLKKYKWSWSFFNQAKILTAKLEYKNGEWLNKDIHDTHINTTLDDYYFPQDLHLSDEIINEMFKNLLFICKNVFKIVKKSDIKTFDEVVNSFEILGLDFMILDDYSIKLIEVNNKLGYGVLNKNSDKVKKYSFDFFEWIYENGINPHEKDLIT